MVLGNKIVGRSEEETKLTLGQEGIRIPLRVLSGPQGRLEFLRKVGKIYGTEVLGPNEKIKKSESLTKKVIQQIAQLCK